MLLVSHMYVRRTNQAAGPFALATKLAFGSRFWKPVTGYIQYMYICIYTSEPDTSFGHPYRRPGSLIGYMCETTGRKPPRSISAHQVFMDDHNYSRKGQASPSVYYQNYTRGSSLTFSKAVSAELPTPLCISTFGGSDLLFSACGNDPCVIAFYGH